MKIHLQAISETFLARVREDGIDDQNQPVWRVTAKGGEPCRDVLRRARPGEDLILASHSAFAMPGPYKEYGPIFVLAEASRETINRRVLPVGGTGTYFNAPFVLRAYDKAQTIADASLVDMSTANAVLERFLMRPEITFVDARFAAYGCFGCRIVRA